MWGLISWPNALILLGTILAAWANYKFTSKRKRLREQLVFIGIIISAAGGVWGSSQQETLEQQLFDITTGGDSFCYMTFSFPSDTLNTPHVAITLEGKYPLHNVRVIVQDYGRLEAAVAMPKGKENMRPITSHELAKLKSIQKEITLPYLGPPGTAMLVSGWPLPNDADKVTYNVNLFTPHKQFNQHLKLKKVNGSWRQAYIVYQVELNDKLTVLREHVPGDFPTDQAGKVNWSYF